MTKISNIKMLALFLAYSFFTVADLDASSKHSSQTKYISTLPSKGSDDFVAARRV